MQLVPIVTNVKCAPSTDGTLLVMILTLGDETTTTFAIPLVDLPSVIVHMLSETKRVSENCAIEKLEGSIKPFEGLATGVSRIAIGPSDEKENAMLELDIGHIALRFKLPIATLLALSHRVIQMTSRLDP